MQQYLENDPFDKGMLSQKSESHFRLKRLFNKSESAAYDGLVNAVGKDHLVVGKVKLTDVVEVGSSGLSDAEFDYATRAHLDFVIYRHNAPVIAVEIDCSPKSTKGQRQADLKDRICLDLGLTFFRLDYRISCPSAVQAVMSSLISDYYSTPALLSEGTDIFYKKCVTHGRICRSSRCFEFQSIAEFIFVYHDLTHPNQNKIANLRSRVKLKTTYTSDGYFESEVSIVAGKIAQRIGEGRCRCSTNVHDLGRLASQKLALADASDTIANFRQGLFPDDQECILTNTT